MELFVNECKTLSQCQSRALRQISIMQPSDILLLNGAHGTGKTITCLNAASMALKISDESRIVVCCNDQNALLGMLELIKRHDRQIHAVGHLLSNLTIVANQDKQLIEGMFTDRLIEQQAMHLFMQQYAQNSKYSQVIDLIRRTKAAERLLQLIVKTRDGQLIDPKNDEAKNMRIIGLIESTFFDDEQSTLFLNQPRELYCSSLVEFIQTVKT